MKIKVVLLILLVSVFLFGSSVFDKIIKKSDIYGESFNSVRKENNIETLNEDWIIDSEREEEFRITWVNTKNNVTKTIEYGFFGAKKEWNAHVKGDTSTYYSTFDFNTKKTEYSTCMCAVVEVCSPITKEEYLKYK